ncbi:diguanylate cyclase domain-containing protein [Clostridium butyricum]|uniref:diguanylate cyclase domain-containing protein n=1 Tax=Clostridium butyricum TaxID=1492 RepID=UPI0009BF9327
MKYYNIILYKSIIYAFSCNKSVFFTQVEKYLKQNKNSKCALIFLDLDNLKLINDNFGHLTGDNVIKES